MTALINLTTAEVIKKIDYWIKKFPENQRQSAILPAMLLLQDAHHGWLSQELLAGLADYLGISAIAAYEVATFYSMIELKPIGRHKISVCTNLSCLLNGSDQIVAHLERKCGTKLGETSIDEKFTLREVECMGACIGAPMLEYNKKYYEKLNPEKIDQLLETME
jgi:NADH-quinone oxidoreductase subunit E